MTGSFPLVFCIFILSVHAASTTPSAMYLFVSSIFALFSHVAQASPSVKLHDSSFVPDRVLSITYQDVPLNCESRLSTVVNGSVPGPVLRIPEGKRTWIRVYNDMPEQNLTMVSTDRSIPDSAY